jgi:hypothetical protein
MGNVRHDWGNKHRRVRIPQPRHVQQFTYLTRSTSLIAIMLGRLKMPLKDCIQAYKDLSRHAFTNRNLISRASAKATLGPKFNKGPLESAIKSVIQSWLGDPEEALLWAEDNPCNCKV